MEGKPMKNLFFLSAMFSLSMSTVSGQGWELMNPKPSANNLFSVFFPSPDTGYLVGGAGTILKTTDAGEHWTMQDGNLLWSLRSVYFTDTEHGFAVGAFNHHRRTVDGGQTWTGNNPSSGYCMTSVHFPTPDTGYIVNEGEILKSTNAGLSWSIVEYMLNYLHSVFFIDADHGFVGGDCVVWNFPGLYRTVDAGLTWIECAMPNSVNINSVYFPSATIGYAAGYDVFGDVGSIFKTNNAGVNWNTISTTLSDWIRSVHFSTDSTGYAVGDYGVVYKITDGGDHYTLQNSGTDKTLFSVFATDENTAFITGQAGTLLKTTDGGVNWIQAGSGIFTNFIDVACPDADHVYVSGVNGTICFSADSGMTWTVQPTNTNQNLNSVDFINATTGYATGDSGTILRTTDGGMNWESLMADSSNNWYSVCFPVVDTGYVAGGDYYCRRILKTENGGNDWTTLLADSLAGGLRSVYFLSSETGAAAGGSRILRTLDGGMIWDTVYQGQGGVGLVSVWMPDEHSIYAAGSESVPMSGPHGILVYSLDGGLNWTEIYPSNMEYLTSISFTDADTGYMTGYWFTWEGSVAVILKTTNGGQTWAVQNTRNENLLQSLEMSGPGYGFAVGGNGSILRTTTGGSVPTGIPSFQAVKWLSLHCYPNPFSGAAVIAYELPSGGEVTLVVYDYLGRRVASLVKEQQAAGTYQVQWDAQNLSDGIYFARLTSGNQVYCSKLIHMR